MSDPFDMIRELRRTEKRIGQTEVKERSLSGIRVRVFDSGGGALTSGATTALGFDSERYDPIGMHSAAVNTSRLTAQYAGMYHITGTVRFAPHATGLREIAIRVNGLTSLAVQDSAVNSAAHDTILTVTTDYELAVGDYVELLAFQNSGGNLNVVATSDYSPVFMMHRVA